MTVARSTPSARAPRTPTYRRHRASGQAVVTLHGKDHYLGPWKSKASLVEFDRLVGEWIAGGRGMIQPGVSATATPLVKLLAAYWAHATVYYRKNGEPTSSLHAIKVTSALLRARYAKATVDEFTPLSLKAMVDVMVAKNWSRSYCNKIMGCIRRLFKWGVANGLVPITTYQALLTVDGLRQGRTTARETPPVLPVADDVVETTLPHLSPVVADMIRLQRRTGARPEEVCKLRPCDVGRSAEVWRYVPSSHKTEHHGRQRVILLGPAAQAILAPYLDRAPSAFCFSPIESEALRHQRMRAARKTKVQPSQVCRKKKRPERSAGDHYTTESYRRAIDRACDLAWPCPKDLKTDAERRAWKKAHRWAPNRLRHTAATEIRKRFGLEAAQVALGHAKADVSQIYAERDLSLAERVAAEIG